MPVITKTVIVPALGVGRPDYSGETWQAKTLKRLELHAKETLKQFAICSSAIPSPYAWVVPPLAVGVPTYLIDVATGFPMPFVVPAGYTFEIMLIMSSFTQNQRIFNELDTFLLTEVYNDAMNVYYDQEIIGLDTKYIDPGGLAAHLIGYGGENIGLAAMRGSGQVVGILHDLHTEVPTSKTIRCKWCGNTTSTSLTTVQWKCPKCGQENRYFQTRGGGK